MQFCICVPVFLIIGAYFIVMCRCTVPPVHTDSPDTPKCISNYQQLERAITMNGNINRMTNGFYPPNRQATAAANIYYVVSSQPSSEYVYKYRWSESPVLQLIRPELLRDLSLFLYHGRTETITVVIPPLCAAPTIELAIQSNSDEICWSTSDTDHPVHMLNIVTINVSVLYDTWRA